MKFKIKKRWSAPQQIADTPCIDDKTPDSHTANATQPDRHAGSANPRDLGNPYGRLFTTDKKFSDLPIKSKAHQTGEVPTPQNAATTPDRTANTVLPAPEKQAK